MKTTNDIKNQLIKIDINHTIKTSQLDYQNKQAFKLVLDLLHGKKRDTYKTLLKETLKMYEWSKYMTAIIKNAFEYKENKIISKIEFLPVSTLIKITKAVKIGLDASIVKNVFSENMTVTEYNAKMLETLENETPKKQIEFNLENEIKKLLEIDNNDKIAIIQALQATMNIAVNNSFDLKTIKTA